MHVKYGKVIISRRATELDRLYTYIIDSDMQDLVKVGMRVIVPFGRGNKVEVGLLVQIVDDMEESFQLKKIIDVLDDKPLISKLLIDLGLWIKEEYLSTYYEAFQPILPPGDFKEVNTFIQLNSLSYIADRDEEDRIIDYLKNNDKKIIPLQKLKDDLKIRKINNYINLLEEKGVISLTIDITTTINIKTEKWIEISPEIDREEKINSLIESRFHGQKKIAYYMFQKKNMLVADLIKGQSTSMNTLKELEKKGIVNIYDKNLLRDPIKDHIPLYGKHKLSSSQKEVFKTIKDSIENKSRKNKFLIHGVTGSGKTEIYLQLVEEVLKVNKSAIILVPEISLTPQTIDRFVGRFGQEVAILHSRLSQGERFDQWRKIKEGQVNIVVGARSAIFAPFKNLGLVIIDEEHESTYKSSQNPKYSTVELAKKRVDLEGAYLILGTATPSMETYYKAVNNQINLLELKDRINKNQMPDVSLVDMREELKSGNRSILSDSLRLEMENNLNMKKQTIIFLNRRGFSTFVTCRECGYVAKCENCDISLTYYKNINKLRCHYCGITEDVPIICPVCKSKYIRHFGIGTEKVEEYIRQAFPHARVERMDGDTTSRKGSHEAILRKMNEKVVDILIGTQMIAKGLDFENVTLVGIIAADTSLNLPDYRAPERTFQLITQVAGRAGRGNYPGKVVLQTYNPDHFSILHAQKQDFESFYKSEIQLRREFLYPPFVNIISILVYGSKNQRVCKLSKEIYNIIGEEIYKLYGDSYYKYLNGPNPAPLEKIKKNFRWLIIIKAEDIYLDKLKKLIKRVCIINEYKLDFKDLKISIDINPNSIL